MDEVIKVVFLGIDNAGKTTISNILSKQYSFLDNITPTKAILRQKTELFGYSILNWDVPGQQRFREALTFKDERTLKDSDVLIFVIDVQDVERTSLAVDFLERVLKKIDEAQEVPYIAVFIHKLDPDIKDNRIIRNAKFIQDEIKQISIGYNVEFFLTTMYIEATLLIAFSNTIIKTFSKRKRQQDLKSIVEQLANELELNSLVILDKNNFIMHSFERIPNTLEILQDFAYSLMSSFNNAKKYNLQLDELKLNLKNQTFVFMEIVSDIGETYIVGSGQTADLSLIPLQSRLLSALKAAFK